MHISSSPVSFFITPLQARHPPSLVQLPNTEQWEFLPHRMTCKAHRAAVFGVFWVFLVIFFPFRLTDTLGRLLCLTYTFPSAQLLPALFEMRKIPSCLTYLPHNSPISSPVRPFTFSTTQPLPLLCSPCPAYLFHTPAIDAKFSNCQSLPPVCQPFFCKFKKPFGST